MQSYHSPSKLDIGPIKSMPIALHYFSNVLAELHVSLRSPISQLAKGVGVVLLYRHLRVKIWA